MTTAEARHEIDRILAQWGMDAALPLLVKCRLLEAELVIIRSLTTPKGA